MGRDAGQAQRLVGGDDPLVVLGVLMLSTQGGDIDFALGPIPVRGKLDLDAPVGIYAPDLPPRVGSVTLAQLLSHTAGLDDARRRGLDGIVCGHIHSHWEQRSREGETAIVNAGPRGVWYEL